MPAKVKKHRVRRAGEERFDQLFRMFLFANEFYKKLPTPEERSLFARLHPDDFYSAFHFGSHVSDSWPASITFGNAVFSRPDFPAWLERQTAPRKPFAPPDVRGLKWGGIPEIAAARARWWIENQWPMNADERAWLKKHDVELFLAARKCPDE